MDFLDILAVLLCSQPHTINTKFTRLLGSLSFVKVTQDFPGASNWDSLFLKWCLRTICYQSNLWNEKIFSPTDLECLRKGPENLHFIKHRKLFWYRWLLKNLECWTLTYPEVWEPLIREGENSSMSVITQFHFRMANGKKNTYFWSYLLLIWSSLIGDGDCN